MRATTAILALAGSAIAAPNWSKPQQYKEVQNVHVVYETVVHTVYFTEGQQQPAKPTPASPVSEAPAVKTTVVYEEAPAAPTSAPVEYSEAPAPAPAPSTSTTEEATSTAAPAAASTGDLWQPTVDTWRAKLGLKPLTRDDKLIANAQDTVDSSNGQMVHKLNPGSFGQVLAPGDRTATGFEHVFVGGWLCEIPTLPGLDGVCATQSEGWSYQGQTGHAEILTSPNYSKIGCAEAAGIWCCDLA